MEKKNPEITFKKVFSNFIILSELTYFYIKSDSYTVTESSRKFKEFQKTKKNMKRFGIASTLIPLASLGYFCLKTKFYKTKVFFGISYFFLSSHFYVLGSHLGVLSGLTSTIKNLYEIEGENLDNKIFKKYIDLVFIENKVFSFEDIYKDKYKDDEIFEEITENKYVKNDYFFKNRDKYLDNKADSKQYNIIPSENFKVKAPIYDCFFTRYCYSHMRRFVKKFKNLDN